MNKETKERTSSQRDRIIALLKQAGDKGVLNTQLSKVALRYNARIQELYVRGYKIESEDLECGLTKYILRSEPTEQFNKPEKAEALLINDIKNKYSDVITSEQLQEYLDTHGFTVRRKVGSFC